MPHSSDLHVAVLAEVPGDPWGYVELFQMIQTQMVSENQSRPFSSKLPIGPGVVMLACNPSTHGANRMKIVSSGLAWGI